MFASITEQFKKMLPSTEQDDDEPGEVAEEVRLVNIRLLRPYKDNPFLPYSEEKMATLVDSIRHDGLQIEALKRQNALSGGGAQNEHRQKSRISVSAPD